LFEVGHVFLPPALGEVLPREHEELAAVMSGERVDARAAAELFVVLAEALRLAGWRIEPAAPPGMHPTRAATILGSGVGDEGFETSRYGSAAARPGHGASASRALGVLGEVDPAIAESWGLQGRVAYLALDLERFLSEPKRPLQAKPASRFPSSDIDLAFVVGDSVPAADLEATLRASGGDLLESVRLFDVYRGGSMPAGRRSLAFRLRFRAEDRTLGVEDLTKLRQKAIEAALQSHGAELRA
jgi:phenylalanyl-tRNA synthetase beta chain